MVPIGIMKGGIPKTLENDINKKKFRSIFRMKTSNQVIPEDGVNNWYLSGFTRKNKL